MRHILGSSSYGRCALSSCSSPPCAPKRLQDRRSAVASVAAANDFLLVGIAAASLWCGNPHPGECALQSLPVSSRSPLCTVSPAQGRGFQYVYPSSWKVEKVRGIEVLAHDPDVEKLNLAITSGPAQLAVLGSPEEVGRALLARYQGVPDVKEAELLNVDSFSDGDNGWRTYTLEMRIHVNNELQHFLFRILRTDKKVFTLVLAVPEFQWLDSADCARALLEGLRSN